jgi:hypothetical protein
MAETATTATPITSTAAPKQPQTGTESSLSTWVGPYVTEMLGQGQALAATPYQAYMGPLTAGQSAAQTAAFQGVANLAVPTQQMGAWSPQEFTADVAQQYMSPYLQASLDPQIAEARRASDIARIAQAGRLTKAGAYGGGRQAVMESELDRALLDKIAGITATGYQTAYDNAVAQFAAEQERQRQAQELANTYGLQALQKQADLGAAQRAIESEGIAADIKQFETEQAFPYKQVQYMQSLLQGLPLATQSYTYQQPSTLERILAGSSGTNAILKSLGLGTTGGTTGGISTLLANLFGGGGGGEDLSAYENVINGTLLAGGDWDLGGIDDIYVEPPVIEEVPFDSDYE